MFRAIADNLEGKQDSHGKYRRDAVDYIWSHEDEFRPFMEELKDKTKDPLDEYCRKMRKDSTWGGQHELKALALQYKFNVIIHQVGSPNVVNTFHEPLGSVDTVHLSYHLGKHYNSVRRVDDPVKRDQPPSVYFPIGHDLEKTGQRYSKEQQRKETTERIKREGQRVFENKFVEGVSDSAFNWLGFMVSGDTSAEKKELIRATSRKMYQNLVDWDQSKTWQKTFNMYESESSDESDGEFDDHAAANPDTLRRQLGQLESDAGLVVSTPIKSYLHNLTLANRPSDNEVCPCEQNTELAKKSRHKYKDCCKQVDSTQRNKVIEEIKQYFKDRDGTEEPEQINA